MQLRLCKQLERDDDNALVIECGFECRHCRNYRKFPKSSNAVADEFAYFRYHLNKCKSAPEDLRKYLSWLERAGLDAPITTTLVRLIRKRLVLEERTANAALAKARKRAMLRKRKKSHSVLEDVESLV